MDDPEIDRISADELQTQKVLEKMEAGLDVTGNDTEAQRVFGPLHHKKCLLFGMVFLFPRLIYVFQ
jgi:hypothetical protein